MTELLSFEQVAARLGVSVRTIRRYHAEGRLRAIYLSPKVPRVKSTELEAFIAACERRGRAA